VPSPQTGFVQEEQPGGSLSGLEKFWMPVVSWLSVQPVAARPSKQRQEVGLVVIVTFAQGSM